MLKKGIQRGDTIVEVLFASALFGMIAAASFAVMYQGIASAERSLELSQVREQIDTQARSLRFLAEAYVADYGKHGQASKDWQQVIEANAIAPGQAQPLSDVAQKDQCVLPASKFFALNYEKLSSPQDAILRPTASPLTYAKIRYDADVPQAEGVWIQAVRSALSEQEAGYYDFHITACWNSPGQTPPVTLGTIVRIYEPRG